MKTSLFLLLWLATVLSLPAQQKEKIKGNRMVVTKIYPLPYFQAVQWGEDLEVVLKPASDTVAVELRADENLHDVLDWEIRDSVLVLFTTKQIIKKKAFDITLFVDKNLKRIKMTQSAKGKTDGKLVFNHLTVQTADYAKGEMAVKANDTLQVLMEGKSKLNWDGEAPVHMYVLTDNAHLKGVVEGKTWNVKTDKSAKVEVGGGIKELKAELKGKSVLDAENLGVRSLAVMRLYDKAEASLKGKSSDIEMHLTGKSHLHLSGEFKKYDLKTFLDNSSLTREP